VKDLKERKWPPVYAEKKESLAQKEDVAKAEMSPEVFEAIHHMIDERIPRQEKEPESTYIPAPEAVEKAAEE